MSCCVVSLLTGTPELKIEPLLMSLVPPVFPATGQTTVKKFHTQVVQINHI